MSSPVPLCRGRRSPSDLSDQNARWNCPLHTVAGSVPKRCCCRHRHAAQLRPHRLLSLGLFLDGIRVRDQVEAFFEDVCLVELLGQLPDALIDKP